mmetsp:Transcript_7620/g.15543  ORF Transcript_7620/g.15543 Transcript_7620/m.15543 type:complete len:212 (-) Transcript_7620:433-1068(-)
MRPRLHLQTTHWHEQLCQRHFVQGTDETLTAGSRRHVDISVELSCEAHIAAERGLRPDGVPLSLPGRNARIPSWTKCKQQVLLCPVDRHFAAHNILTDDHLSASTSRAFGGTCMCMRMGCMHVHPIEPIHSAHSQLKADDLYLLELGTQIGAHVIDGLRPFALTRRERRHTAASRRCPRHRNCRRRLRSRERRKWIRIFGAGQVASGALTH